MSEVRSGYVAFRPRARLLKLIGEELISDEVVAITELVKNAHDADASGVTVSFRRVSGPDGEIVVHDDGCGMDHETFLGGWMEPAGSTKADSGSKVTRTGRRVLGEKGVGRFAADKLGRFLELISRRTGHPEVRAEFDWDQFDSEGEMLSSIKNRWEVRPVSEITKQGTTLRIYGLREAWTERMFKRLSTRLARLQSPFGSQHGFSIRIETDEFPEYSGELRSTFLDRAPYTLELEFDGRDTLRLELAGKRRTLPAPPSAGRLSCGPVRVRLYAFDLETEAIARVGPRHEVRAWLREWSGVSVYRDGFRIWPYGEPHDDWLRLDQRRVNNPVVCLSNNQVVGFIEIGSDKNPELMDQTSREGLIHNQAFEDLRRIVEHAFQQLEVDRQRLRHPADGSVSRRRSSNVHVPVADAIERVATLADRKTQRELRRVVEEAREGAERQENEREKLMQGYADLAAAGEAAIGVGTVLRTLVDRLRSDLDRVSQAGGAQRALLPARSTIDEIVGHLSMLVDLGAPGSHKRRTMDVVAEVESFRSLMSPLLSERHTAMIVTSEADQLLRVDMNPHSFRRVLHILLANSLDWILRTQDPRISIHVRAAADRCEVTFSDNGPGMSPDLAAKVFEPMFTTKEGGRGMGLTIARALVQQNGGRVDVVLDGRRRGAHVRILLPRKRSRATVHA
jgi:signal transduction histidine kinase